jgi:hypothetical protein
MSLSGKALHPVDEAIGELNAFRKDQLPPNKTIGLHIRHGNGGNIMGHSTYWTSFPKAMARCRFAVQTARASLGRDSVVLLCTDSIEVQQTVLDQISAVVYRDKKFRDPGCGELHRWRGAASGRIDALVEMLLLAECDALVRYPPGSFFSFYGAVMKRSQLPCPETVYDLQRGCDAGDPFSAALLV